MDLNGPGVFVTRFHWVFGSVGFCILNSSPLVTKYKHLQPRKEREHRRRDAEHHKCMGFNINIRPNMIAQNPYSMIQCTPNDYTHGMCAQELSKTIQQLAAGNIILRS